MPRFAHCVAVLVSTTGCAESIQQVHSQVPVLLGPVDHIGGGPSTAPAASPDVSFHGTASRSGGSAGIHLDLFGIDRALGAATGARRDVDVHLTSLRTGGWIFFMPPYVPYPIMVGKTWTDADGVVVTGGGQ